MRYRIYIDETGNHDLEGSTDPNIRFLSLTGVIIESKAAQARLQKAIDHLKGHFRHSSSPVILHRRDIVNRYPPFDVLLDPRKAEAFDRDLLLVCEGLNYVAITVVIDKLDHLSRYKVWRMDPYHYCLEAMLERYCNFLKDCGGTGDVMIETRNKKLDKKLKRLYWHFYGNGNDNLSATDFQTHFTSKEIKIKAKEADIAGLQLSDLLAHPAAVGTRCRQFKGTMTAPVGARIYEILERAKYRRSPWGKIDGWGRKWLP